MVPNNVVHLATAHGRRDDALGGAAEIPTAKAMIPDIDIWRCASLMIKHYGDTADIEAAARADEYLAKGELDGQRVWMQIAKAIDELRKVQPGETMQ